MIKTILEFVTASFLPSSGLYTLYIQFVLLSNFEHVGQDLAMFRSEVKN